MFYSSIFINTFIFPTLWSVFLVPFFTSVLAGQAKELTTKANLP